MPKILVRPFILLLALLMHLWRALHSTATTTATQQHADQGRAGIYIGAPAAPSTQFVYFTSSLTRQ